MTTVEAMEQAMKDLGLGPDGHPLGPTGTEGKSPRLMIRPASSAPLTPSAQQSGAARVTPDPHPHIDTKETLVNNATMNGTTPATTLNEQAEAEIARLLAENAAYKAALEARTRRDFRLAVAQKSKMLSIYGLGRFPGTFSKHGWLILLDHAEEIKAFIAEHDRELL